MYEILPRGWNTHRKISCRFWIINKKDKKISIIGHFYARGLKKFDPLICPPGGLEETLKKFGPLIRPSGGLEESLKKFDSLIRPSGGLEESLKIVWISYPPFWRSQRILKKSSTLLSPLRAVSKNPLKIRPSYPSFRRSRRIPKKFIIGHLDVIWWFYRKSDFKSISRKNYP